MNKRTFYKNTAVITGCSLLLRVFGIVFRILVSNRIGNEGMGLYQLVFSIYLLGSTFATGGLTTAITRLAGEHLIRNDQAGIHRLMRVSSLLCLAVGCSSAMLLYFGAPIIGPLAGDSRTSSAIAICGVALPFIGISACLKGYFLARRRAWPPCLSQMAEQAIRIGSVLGMLNYFWDGSLAQGCALMVLGDALSETVACLYLLVAYRRDRQQQDPPTHRETPTQSPMKPLLNIALPLTGGRYLSTGLRTVENILVPTQLTHFTRSNTLALAQFGAVKGMALPLIFFPSALLMTVSGLLIPELSDAHALGQRRQVARLVESSLHITLLGAIGVGGLFTTLGKPLGILLYDDAMVGMLLQVLGPLTPVMYLDSISSALLKGLGQQMHTLWFAVVDSAVRILLIWWLLPHFGLTGFLFVMIVSNLLTGTLSTGRLLTVSGGEIQWGRWILRPILAAVLSSGLCRLLPEEGLGYVLVASGMFILVYGLCLILLRCVSKEDWQQLIARKGHQKTAVG